MRLVLPSALRELVGGRSVIEVEVDAESGAVRDLLNTMRTRHPSVHDSLVTELGALRPHVNIFVDGENIRFRGGLDAPVATGSEVMVLPAVSGG